jgi:asparagine synthase (glutamine-hydrolysing)
MCGIAGSFGEPINIKEALGILEERGPDSEGFYDTELHFRARDEVSSLFIGSRRLEVTGGEYGLQPIKKSGMALVSNSEIYNFRKLGDYKSDSEAIIDHFKNPSKLDGVFAFAMMNEKDEVILGRDFFGVKPLYLGETVFSSLKRGVEAFGKKPALFPRATVRNMMSGDELRFSLPASVKSERILRDNWIDAVRKREYKDITVAFSGGLDSSLIAFTLREFTDCNITLETACLESSHDFKASKKAAEILELPHKIHIIEEDVLEKKVLQCKDVVEEDIFNAKIATPLFVTSENSKNRVIFSGQGADELFFGYKKYEKDPARRDIDLDNLDQNNLSRDDKAASHFGRELRLPYLDISFASSALQFSPKEHLESGRKTILRRLSRELGLPKELSEAPKKAAQYSSGVDKALRL